MTLDLNCLIFYGVVGLFALVWMGIMLGRGSRKAREDVSDRHNRSRELREVSDLNPDEESLRRQQMTRGARWNSELRGKLEGLEEGEAGDKEQESEAERK